MAGGKQGNEMYKPRVSFFDFKPLPRKRIRSDLSNSDDDHVHSEDEQEDNPSTVDVNYPRFIVLKPIRSHESLTKLSPFAVAKSIQGLYGTVKQVSRLKDGSLLIEASRNIQAKHILDTHRFLDIDVDAEAHRSLKVLRPSGPNYWKNDEWIPYVFCKEYCSEFQTNGVMGQKFGTITLCHLLKLFFLIFNIGRNVKLRVN